MSEIKHYIYPSTGVEHYGEIIDSKDGFDVIGCNTCGFKHVIPIPTPEEMNKYYSKQFIPERPLYIERFHEDLDWWKMVYKEKYKLFEKYLPPNCRRILDIGCGLGLFLKEGIKRGWKTIGIEPSQQAAKHAKNLGLEIIDKPFDEYYIGRIGKFDVIYMHEVLEHIPDPIGIIKIVYQLLKTNGLFCVIVPNDYNPLQKIFCEQSDFEPWWIAPPVHVNYFTFDSLKQLLCSHDFKVLQSRGTFPMEIFLLMGDNYIGDDTLGRACHNRRKNLEINLGLGGLDRIKNDLYTTLAKHNIGREIVILAKKVKRDEIRK